MFLQNNNLLLHNALRYVLSILLKIEDKMKTYNSILTILVLIFCQLNTAAQISGGEILPEQAAYDVKFYELDLDVDPETETISGSLLARVDILESIDTLVFNFTDSLNIDSIQFGQYGDSLVIAQYNRRDGKIYIDIADSTFLTGLVEAKIYYNGDPSYDSPGYMVHFYWHTSESGAPWITVSCELEGGDKWWPCKDHPSDEPDSMSLNFTVPKDLVCAANGIARGITDNIEDSTRTFHWFIPSPINNYNVTLNIGEYELIEDTYQSINGNEIPFYFWVLPESYDKAVNQMTVFKTEFDFLESICGPFPFSHEKHGWAQVPYYGMEHQSIIAYGNNFELNRWGMDYIHLHELAHEWWGNLVTAKSWSDFWIHEGFANYMEALYIEKISGVNELKSFMGAGKPLDNDEYPLAPREEMTIADALHYLNPYRRGMWALHTLRSHLGDDLFFSALKQWAYPDTTDTDNANGRLCKLVDTDDFKDHLEKVGGLELDNIFETLFREASFPKLELERSSDETFFTWITDADVPFDLNLPIRAHGKDTVVIMENGTGAYPAGLDDVVVVDPHKFILIGDITYTSIEDNGSIIPADFELKQNFPNPFNPSCKIRYSIPIQTEVELKVFDVRGNEVSTLVSEYQTPGNYEINFNVSNLGTGVYLYQIRAGSFRESKKMLLIK